MASKGVHCHLGAAPGVWTARSLSCLAKSHERRPLTLSDSMGWVCAAAKKDHPLGQCVAVSEKSSSHYVALRGHAGSIRVVPRAARLDDMAGSQADQMVEGLASPLLPCCTPDCKTAASPLIPMTTLSTSRRKRNRDQLAQMSGSDVARASLTVARVARRGVPFQMLAVRDGSTCNPPGLATRSDSAHSLTTSQCDDQVARHLLWLHQGAPRDEAVKVLCAVRWSRPPVPRMSKGLCEWTRQRVRIPVPAP